MTSARTGVGDVVPRTILARMPKVRVPLVTTSTSATAPSSRVFSQAALRWNSGAACANSDHDDAEDFA